MYILAAIEIIYITSNMFSQCVLVDISCHNYSVTLVKKGYHSLYDYISVIGVYRKNSQPYQAK